MEKKMMHLAITESQVGKYVFLPGSVERAAPIAVGIEAMRQIILKDKEKETK